MVNVNLMKGDCLELMKSIPDGGVDLILTDPPYGTTACKWDSVIPFESMWEQLKRIIKPNGAIVLFGSEPFSSALRMSNIKQYKYDWKWEKEQGTGFANSKKMPLKSYEDCMVFYFKPPLYNPQGLIPVNKKRKHKQDDVGEHLGKNGLTGKDFFQEFSNYPKSILKFNRDKGFHPTQKPVALLEYLIKTYTQENETVLDFTAGSMSTAIACINTNRNGIMIEKDDHYFKVGSDRVSKALQELGSDRIKQTLNEKENLGEHK